ncbi:MAG: hypothetical protein Q4G27_08200 [Flavobacteriaceae bacterium]|nr:hypothetical protein [Flavobacteriaceae bacterium]
MKEIRVEVVIYYNAEWTFKIDRIEKKFASAIQERIDKVMAEGYKLVNTNSSMYSSSVYTQLYFEKI